MFFVLFSKTKPTWWNTVFISKKRMDSFPLGKYTKFKNDRNEYIKKRGLD